MRAYSWGTAMDDKHLAQLAENTARSLRVEGKIPAHWAGKFLLQELEKIERFQERLTVWAAEQKRIPQAAEWLLDNWYLAQREGREAAACFRHTKQRLRAVCRDGRHPAVLDLARALAWAGEVTAERLALFLKNAQQGLVLTELELALFVPALKGALVERLALIFKDMEPLLSKQEHMEAERSLVKAIEEIFAAFRSLSAENLGKVLEEASLVEQTLRKDPAGVYGEMDEGTRACYRQEVCRLARHRGMGEVEVAQKAFAMAEQGEGQTRHIGYFLFRKPLGEERPRTTGAFYVSLILLPTLFAVLWMGFTLRSPLVTLLLLLPVSDVVKNSIDFLSVRLVPPRHVHRMELEKGIPQEGTTLCVIASLLTGPESGVQLCTLLERYRLANRDAGKNLLFGILADLPDSDLPMGTAARGYVESAKQAVEALNQKYGGGFYIFFRAPIFQPRDERYLGWERKRGALLELGRLLRGKRTGMRALEGNTGVLKKVRYVITLDSDTSLNIGAARELVGAMLHPLNRPELDTKRRVVTRGYGLLQPRIGVELGAANRSQFARIFAGQGGIDPYSATASDVYHDLFDQGTYTGKGIFEVDTFLTCLDGRFPQNTILSHDLLEGAYLHAGLISDIELTDSYPYKVPSYFSRLHRWVRGDWQLLPWLRNRVRNQEGECISNPIPPIAKWKIFDNLRRSLSPVCTLLALLLGMCIPGPAFAAAAVAAVLSAASNLLLSGADLALRRGRGLRERYHSTIIVGFGGVILQTLLQLLFLPYHAWTCASAIVTALWRSLVSHRGMLAWVTAADTEKRAGNRIGSHYRKQWSAAAVGAASIAFALYPAGAALGLVWIASPIFSWAMSRPLSVKAPIPPSDLAFLLHEGALIWRYFTDFLRAEDHWLPPDNWQEQPAVGLARRTSPTNIGMALLCVLAAVDLELYPKQRAVELLGHMLDTLERLPKWNGHLYNWYDTAAAAPLQPRYVSTVDSGNLCASLIAFREGLYEWQETELARRAEKLSDAMDFQLLYDRERKLFFIGYDAEQKTYTKGWYDLMASEARQTSYLAVARGEVEPKHWRRLGRTLVRENQFSGMASWTGTMFEYFMPNLLLPCERNSLMYESLAFCLYAQRHRTAGRDIPWGISESCFYVLDPGMNYQYKAHGVQKLGLKRGLDSELVVAPYASFLALLLAPGSAGRNLRALRDMGLEGKYGLYEAADFTQSRLTGDQPWEPVRCFMVHHLGMSLVAIDNVLKDQVMQKRFMRDCAMGAYRELLQEKVPVGAVVLRTAERDVPEKPQRVPGTLFERSGEGCSREYPACHLVSNGHYTVFCTDSGASVSSFGETVLTRAEFRTQHRTAGISFFFQDELGQLYPLTKAPLWAEEGEFSWKFKGDGAEWSIKQSDFRAVSTLRVSSREEGELREVCIQGRENGALKGTLVCYFEPVLAGQRAYESHPAFNKLSIESREVEGGVVFTRRPRERGGQSTALAVVWDAEEAGFDTSREDALGRGGLRGLGHALQQPPAHTVGAVLDPCLLVRFPVRLAQGGRERFRLSLAAAQEPEEAILTARRLLRLPKAETRGYLDGLLSGARLTREAALQAFQLMEQLAFPTRRSSGEGLVPSQQALWPYGISGDDPIAVCLGGEENTVDKQLEWVKRYLLLRRCGFYFDLIFLLQDGGDYRRPVRNGLFEGIKALGAEQWLGRRSGIHLVDNLETEAAIPILAAAAVVFTPGAVLVEREEEKGRLEWRPLPFALEKGCPEYQFEEHGAFVFHAGLQLPPVGWSHILANTSFGWMPDETGCGHLWYQNARENQLTPWENDPLMVGGAERLFVRKDGLCCSVFADTDGLDCAVSYGAGYARWEKTWGELTIRVTAFVPPDTPTRVLQVKLAGSVAGVELCYCVRPLLAAERRAGGYVEVVDQGGYLAVQNPWNRSFWPQSMLIRATEAWREWYQDAEGTLFITWQALAQQELVVGCAASKKEERAILALADLNPAEESLQYTLDWWKGRTGTITVETPDQRLNHYLNGWAAYQTVACRLLGRTSRYQSGGAYGFRDQLQDACAALFFAPALTREQILRACSHQFEEGDVQHWWHPAPGEGADRGVRTRISDDLLWLPYTLCEYLDKTGDYAILKEEIPYLEMPRLAPGEQERYAAPNISREIGCVYDHARRAVEQALGRGIGRHGLALMGAGDWNDGMNHVGMEGRGESVWLTWFTAHVTERFAAVAERAGQQETAALCRAAAVQYTEAANRAWDGNWFLRGYYDDGTTLGSAQDEECQIDSIAQSWSALVNGGDLDQARTAVCAALNKLMDRGAGVVRLFTPAFDQGEKDPGYIQGYVPGVRENGGQYTHAAVWLALACFRLDLAEEGWTVLQTLLPSGRDQGAYQTEPYVLSADVYDNPAHRGRGGWSWYTGAAGWYYRVALEELLGLKLCNGTLWVEPKLPQDWTGYSASWRTKRAFFHIRVQRSGDKKTLLDGETIQKGIVLSDYQGEHDLEVFL